MREYEVLYIVSGALSEDEAAKVTDEVNAALLSLGGKVEDENVWGRRRLAYQIAKQEHGWYIVSRISLDGAKVAEFENVLRLNNNVIRSMTVAAAEVPSAEEAEKARKAAEEADKERGAKRETKPAAAPEKPEAKVATPEPEPAPEVEEKPAKKETAAERKERQAKLDEKLGELLKEE